MMHNSLDMVSKVDPVLAWCLCPADGDGDGDGESSDRDGRLRACFNQVVFTQHSPTEFPSAMVVVNPQFIWQKPFVCFLYPMIVLGIASTELK